MLLGVLLSGRNGIAIEFLLTYAYDSVLRLQADMHRKDVSWSTSGMVSGPSEVASTPADNIILYGLLRGVSG